MVGPTVDQLACSHLSFEFSKMFLINDWKNFQKRFYYPNSVSEKAIRFKVDF